MQPTARSMQSTQQMTIVFFKLGVNSTEMEKTGTTSVSLMSVADLGTGDMDSRSGRHLAGGSMACSHTQKNKQSEWRHLSDRFSINHLHVTVWVL